jgi:hypothetical protein
MRQSGWRLFVSIVFGLAAVFIVSIRIDDPGLTVDEPINTGHGKRMVYAITHDVGKADTSTLIDSLFRAGHEHPPLARLLIGVAHSLVDPEPANPDVIAPKGGRLASAVAFGVLVALVVFEGFLWTNSIQARVAGLATILLPRLCGHASLASPEVISTTFIFAALIACRSLTLQLSEGRQSYLAMLIAGVAIGLAMLTKLTAVTVPLTLTLVLLVSFRHRAIGPLFVVGIVSLATLMLGWPWLWPIDLPGYRPGWTGAGERLIEFFRVGIDRATIYVDYLGQQYPKDGVGVPWHYSLFFFASTVPLVTLLLGGWGWCRTVWAARLLPAARIFALFPVLSLTLFSVPIDRYDSERLFLFVFPVWALFVAIATYSPKISRSMVATAVTGLLLLFTAGSTMISLHPCGLSYFNEIMGGLPGAEKAGVEVTYWGDSVTDHFLDDWAKLAGEGDRAILVPTLYDGHPLMMMTQEMRAKKVAVVPPPAEGWGDAQWAIVFRRSGYLHGDLAKRIMEEGKVMEEVSREGIWLTRLYRLPGQR